MPPLVLSEGEIQQLQSIASSRSLPHSIVQRAQIVLACAAGETNTSIAKRMGLTGMTVGKWRKRYRELGLEGLHDELRSGRPRTYEDDTVAEVINRALQTTPPDGSTHWSARTLAAATGISKTTVHRWLQTFSVQPHRQKYFKQGLLEVSPSRSRPAVAPAVAFAGTAFPLWPPIPPQRLLREPI